MHRTGRRLLARLTEGLPEARYEAVLALLRACVLVAGGLSLLVIASETGSQAAPVVVNLALGVLSLLAAVAVSRVTDPARALAFGRWSTAVDITAFAAYSLAFADRPGAGSTYGVFVLLAGPLRYGLRGVLATAVPVALTAIAWPQVDATGATVGVDQVVALCLIFTAPAVVIRSVMMRSGARLRQAEQQFTTAFDHASIGMALTDLDLTIVQANRALGVLIGESPGHLHGRALDDAVDPLERASLRRALHGLSLASPSARLEVRLRRPDGGLRWGHVSASLLEGRSGVAARIVVQVENITERKRSEAMLSHAAAHDALTDLPNRTLLISQLEAALARGEQVAVLFLDLDRFKVVNDGLGHAAGDQLLVQVAHRLREVMRPEDIVARQGGDEFVVLCRGADAEIASAVASRVLAVLNQPVTTINGSDVVVGASVGIALGGPGDRAEMVLRDADTAMYAAKGTGGGRARMFTPELREAVVLVHELEVDLRSAVRNDQLSVVYQPVVDLALGRVTGCEALVRWHHAERGTVQPPDFIAVAEQSDLILELGDWVLRRALRDAASWEYPAGRTPPTVAVNMSVRQLTSPGFAARVAHLLADEGFAPARLCLEITETALVGDVLTVIEALESLRDVGVRLAIDDFGTGHASLTYLARFPVDVVKVDQSFVAGLGSDAGSAAIVGGVIGMAHTFDLRVVAEGVELESQVAMLRDLGADAVQGFFMARPVPPDQVSFTLHGPAQRALVPRPRAGNDEPVAREPSYDEELRYRLLVEGAKEVTGRLDLHAVLDHAFVALRRIVTFTGGSILLVEDGQVRIAAAMPAPSPEALAARIPLGQGVSGTIAVTGEPRYLPDITIASTVTASRRSNNSSTGVRSWYGVPLIAEGRPIGVLQVDSTDFDAFGEADRLAVLAFAPVVALAVISARRAAEQLEEIQRSADKP
ncbi:MAG TPA: EAL domain-containing protein [Mycobacteriales bacterium]|nr:EAL domain-containing protein [Mycobacteriales bacterium]